MYVLLYGELRQFLASVLMQTPPSPHSFETEGLCTFVWDSLNRSRGRSMWPLWNDVQMVI